MSDEKSIDIEKVMSGAYFIRDPKTKEVKEVESVHLWAFAFEHFDRSVALTKLPGDIRVSTVFLGLNHNFSGGEPLIFETMVFGGTIEGEQERYATEEDALLGHADMVQRVLDVIGE